MLSRPPPLPPSPSPSFLLPPPLCSFLLPSPLFLSFLKPPSFSLSPPSALHPLLYLKIDFHFISIGVDIIHAKITSISFCAGPKLVDPSAVYFRLPAN